MCLKSISIIIMKHLKVFKTAIKRERPCDVSAVETISTISDCLVIFMIIIIAVPTCLHYYKIKLYKFTSSSRINHTCKYIRLRLRKTHCGLVKIIPVYDIMPLISQKHTAKLNSWGDTARVVLKRTLYFDAQLYDSKDVDERSTIRTRPALLHHLAFKW